MVTDAVHDKSGLISCQLLHAGRVAQPGIGDHPLVRGTGAPLPPVSSSATALRPGQDGGDYNWDQPAVQPRALETGEISRVIDDYRRAARHAVGDWPRIRAALDQNLGAGDLERQTPVSALRQSVIDVVVVARFCDEDMPPGLQPRRGIQCPRHDAHTRLTDGVPKQIGPAVPAEPAAGCRGRLIPVQGVTGGADKMFTRARRGGDKVAARSPAHAAVTIKYRTKRSANFVLNRAAKAVPAHGVLGR